MKKIKYSPSKPWTLFIDVKTSFEPNSTHEVSDRLYGQIKDLSGVELIEAPAPKPKRSTKSKPVESKEL